VRKPWLTLAIVLAALHFAARAQTFEVLPEVDAYYRFNPNLRIYFQAKDTREGKEANRIRRKSDTRLSYQGLERTGGNYQV